MNYSVPVQERRFFYKDKSGRGFTNSKMTFSDLIKITDETDYDDVPLPEFAESADVGDEFENNAISITRIT